MGSSCVLAESSQQEVRHQDDGRTELAALLHPCGSAQHRDNLRSRAAWQAGAARERAIGKGTGTRASRPANGVALARASSDGRAFVELAPMGLPLSHADLWSGPARTCRLTLDRRRHHRDAAKRRAPPARMTRCRRPSDDRPHQRLGPPVSPLRRNCQWLPRGLRRLAVADLVKCISLFDGVP